PSHRADVIDEKSARHVELLRSCGRDKGPNVRARSDVVHDAGVTRKVGGCRGSAFPLDVAWRCHNNKRSRPRSAYHQRRIRDLAHTHGEVEPVLNHVAEPVADHKLDLEPRVIGEQGRQTLSEEAAGRPPHTPAPQPYWPR